MEEKAAGFSRPVLLWLIAVTLWSAGCVSMGGEGVPGQCGKNWWRYVYSPKRLVIQDPCVTVRGTVFKARYVLDGDAIIFVHLDPEYAHLSNKGNWLELEIVCRHPVFKFFVFRCWSCNNKIPVPRVGDRIEADGIYVLDDNHRHREIHPVTRITILQGAITKPSRCHLESDDPLTDVRRGAACCRLEAAATF